MAPRLAIRVGGVGPVEPWSVTLQFALGTTLTTLSQLQSIVNYVMTDSATVTAMKAVLATDQNVTDVVGMYYPTATGAASMSTTSTGASYASTTGPIHAPQVCVVVSLRTATAGRSYRGRVYIPYRLAGVLANGSVNTAGQTACATAVSAVQAAVVAGCSINSVAAVPAVFSRTTGNQTTITQLLVGSQCDTQRRRNRNRDETYSTHTVGLFVASESGTDPSLWDNIKNAAGDLVSVFKRVDGAITEEEGETPPIEFVP